jgi:ABC-type polysaccharide/polyol phosphate transport system ATPase subunit
MKKENSIEVVGLTKRYAKGKSEEADRDFLALNNVSFEVRRGESIGIFGHNGSGKSTLLKILAGVTKPAEGTVSIRGRVASILDIGAGFHPELSGRKNIYLNSSVLGFSKKETAPFENQIIEYSGIADFIDEPVKNYSSGMFLRLAFSIVMHLDFDVYLFDEVFAVGDAQFESKATKSLRALSDSDKTVILVSHQISALDKQDKLLHLKNGVLQSFGSDREALVDYLSESVTIADGALEVVTTDQTVTRFVNSVESIEVKLLEVDLKQPSNDEPSFRTNSGFEIEIEYEKLDDSCTLDCLVSIKDLQDSVVLFSSPLVSSSPSEMVDKGIYRLKFSIPPSIFHSRIFTLNVTFLKNARKTVEFEAKDEQNGPIDLQVDNGMEICLECRNVLYFKPESRSVPNSLDLSKFQINSSLVPAFDWQMIKAPK